MAETIIIEPQLSVKPDAWINRDDVPDLEQISRISEFDLAINQDPASFLNVVMHLGGSSIVEGELPSEYGVATETAWRLLEEHLSNRDYVQTAFDTESDEAIYDDEGVRRRLAEHGKLKSRSTKIHQHYISEDHPDAKSTRDELTLYKLYLYIGRVQDYQLQANDAPARERENVHHEPAA